MPTHKTSMTFKEEPIPFRIQITKLITKYIALGPQRKQKEKKIKKLWLRTLQPQKSKCFRTSYVQ